MRLIFERRIRNTFANIIMIVYGRIIYLKKESFGTMIGWNREKSRCSVRHVIATIQKNTDT